MMSLLPSEIFPALVWKTLLQLFRPWASFQKTTLTWICASLPPIPLKRCSGALGRG